MKHKHLTFLSAVLLCMFVKSVIAEEHEFVDLGLPSGILWATCNLGASTPEEYGDYFAWGETTTKDKYSWETYKWNNSSGLTKYCITNNYGIVDNIITLEDIDDAAIANWGGNWHMPTASDFSELIENCTWKWDTKNGVYGYYVYGTNGNSIFLPAARCKNDDGTPSENLFCSYWSSSLHPSTSIDGMSMLAREDTHERECLGVYRHVGMSIRAVCRMVFSTSVTLNYEDYTLHEIGEKVKLNAIILPENATNKNVTWTTSNESVCSVSDGWVTAIGEGTATITVTTEDGGYTASCIISVEIDHPVTGVSLNYAEYSLSGIGESILLEATIQPENATNKNVEWKSYNENVCIVNKGLVVGVGYGIAVVSATTVDGSYMATCTITVEDNTAVTGIQATNKDYKILSIQGYELPQMQKGINIIRFNDGTTKKVLIK